MARNDYKDRKNKKRKKHINKAKKSRRIKQYIMGTIFLILLPFGWFYSLIGYFIPLCMIAGIGIASWKGRKWCNWMCPRGSFSDSYMKVISPERKIPNYFPIITLKNRRNHLPYVHAYVSDCQIMARPICYRKVVHDTPYRYDCYWHNSGDYYPSANLVLYLSHRNNIKLGGKEQTTTLYERRSLHKLQTV